MEKIGYTFARTVAQDHAKETVGHVKFLWTGDHGIVITVFVME
jgi:hypothetical protein